MGLHQVSNFGWSSFRLFRQPSYLTMIYRWFWPRQAFEWPMFLAQIIDCGKFTVSSDPQHYFLLCISQTNSLAVKCLAEQEIFALVSSILSDPRGVCGLDKAWPTSLAGLLCFRWVLRSFPGVLATPNEARCVRAWLWPIRNGSDAPLSVTSCMWAVLSLMLVSIRLICLHVSFTERHVPHLGHTAQSSSANKPNQHTNDAIRHLRWSKAEMDSIDRFSTLDLV